MMISISKDMMVKKKCASASPLSVYFAALHKINKSLAIPPRSRKSFIQLGFFCCKTVVHSTFVNLLTLESSNLLLLCSHPSFFLSVLYIFLSWNTLPPGPYKQYFSAVSVKFSQLNSREEHDPERSVFFLERKHFEEKCNLSWHGHFTILVIPLSTHPK